MDKSLIAKFRKKMRSQRLSLGLSQEELAARAGLHRTYIGMVERAEKNITLDSVQRLMRALDVEVSEFFSDF